MTDALHQIAVPICAKKMSELKITRQLFHLTISPFSDTTGGFCSFEQSPSKMSALATCLAQKGADLAMRAFRCKDGDIALTVADVVIGLTKHETDLLFEDPDAERLFERVPPNLNKTNTLKTELECVL